MANRTGTDLVNGSIFDYDYPVNSLTSLPSSGKTDEIYLVGNEVYLWNGTEFISQGGSESLLFAEHDFINAPTGGINYPFSQNAIGNGNFTIQIGVQTANNPGVIRVNSGTNTNTGGRILTDIVALVTKVGMSSTHIFQIPNLNATRLIRLGLLDTNNQNDAVDGMYFEISNNVVSFKTANNSVRTTNVNTFTMSLNTFYKFVVKVELQSSILTARGVICSPSGVVVYDNSIITNLPTGNLRSFGSGIVAVNTANVATPLIDLDYMNIKASLVR